MQTSNIQGPPNFDPTADIEAASPRSTQDDTSFVVASTTNSNINCFGKTVTYIANGTSRVFNGASECIQCCLDPKTLAKTALVTGIIIVTVAPEVYFGLGSYYCLNEPEAWGRFCTEDKYGNRHSAKQGAAGYIVASIVYPIMAAISLLKMVG